MQLDMKAPDCTVDQLEAIKCALHIIDTQELEICVQTFINSGNYKFYLGKNETRKVDMLITQSVRSRLSICVLNIIDQGAVAGGE